MAGDLLKGSTKTAAGILAPRVVLACGFLAATLICAPCDAQADLQRKSPSKRHEQAKREQSPAPKGPLIISISIASQHLTVYDQSTPVAHAPVSTGMAGHATPMGVFSVIQKQKWHESNIYSGAPMPFMQRITWSGVAMHAGVLPGYPASHGCIRMPPEFAVRLYGMTKMGARVFVTRNDVTPVEFADPRLFTPKLQADARSTSTAPAQASDRPVDTGNQVASTDLMVPIKTTQSPDVVVGDASANNRPDVAISAEVPAAATDAAKVEPADGAASAVDPATVAEPKTAPAKDAAQADPAKPGTSAPTADAAPTSAEPTNAAAASTVRTEAGAAVKVDDAHSVGAEPQNGSAAKIDDPMTPDDVPLPLARPQLASLKPGPISIFISKKLGKLFVRKAFESVFDSAVTIANPERPLGTHVFTATGFTDDHAAMRWLLVSLPAEAAKKDERRADTASHKRHGEKAAQAPLAAASAETAAEALERIDIPQESRERIAELLTPGSSLIISDKDLGGETGESGETDFIVLAR
jgi:L,D-transpeptidase catalytic domain